MSNESFKQTVSFAGAIIEYRSFALADVGLVFNDDKLRMGGVSVVGVKIDGETLRYSDRFGISFATLLKQSPSIFALFDVAEVVARALFRKIVKGEACIAIDRTKPHESVALAVAPIDKHFFTLQHLSRFMESVGSYARVRPYFGSGTFALDFDLSVIHRPFEVHGVQLKPFLNMQLSIDGWGRPAAWLGLEIGGTRQMLQAKADAYRTFANIGEDAGKFVASLTRFTRSFSNEEGFEALRARLEASHFASASLGEICSFERAAINCGLPETAAAKIARLIHAEAGRFSLASLSMVSAKRLVRIPSQFAVSDLIAMAVEFTNLEGVKSAEPLHAWIGRTIADEAGFDLEASLEKPRAPKTSYLAEDTLDDREAVETG